LTGVGGGEDISVYTVNIVTCVLTSDQSTFNM